MSHHGWPPHQMYLPVDLGTRISRKHDVRHRKETIETRPRRDNVRENLGLSKKVCPDFTRILKNWEKLTLFYKSNF